MSQSRRRRLNTLTGAMPELRRALAAPDPAAGPPALRHTACSRFELVSQCPNCGEHQTIARMSNTEDMDMPDCGASMLRSA